LLARDAMFPGKRGNGAGTYREARA
jgi:hypothetical protein